MTDQTNEQLVETVKSHGKSCPEAGILAGRIRDFGFRYLMRKGLDFWESEDLIQEYLVEEIWRGVDYFDPKYGRLFSSYVISTLNRRVLNFIKRKSLLKSREIVYGDAHAIEMKYFSKDNSIELVELESLRDIFFRLVRRIDNRNHRFVMWTRMLMPDLKMVDLAEVFKYNINTMSLWLHRASQNVSYNCLKIGHRPRDFIELSNHIFDERIWRLFPIVYDSLFQFTKCKTPLKQIKGFYGMSCVSRIGNSVTEAVNKLVLEGDRM